MKERIPTFCNICGVHCAAFATVEDGKLVKWEVDKESGRHYEPCVSFKGLGNVEIANHPDRLKYPLKRAGAKGEGKWERISWEQAMDEISRKLLELKEQYGPQVVGASVGEPKTSEFMFIQRFCSAFGTPNVCTPHHLCGANRYASRSTTFGPGGLGGAAHVEKPGLVIDWGNSGGAGERALPERKRIMDLKERGGKLVIIDVRKLWGTDKADLWIKPRPGSDAVLAFGLLKIIIDENLYDKKFVETWTVGFDKVKEEVGRFTLDDVERLTWVPKEQMEQLAHWWVELPPVSIVQTNTWSQGARNYQGERILDILMTIINPTNIPGWGLVQVRDFEQMPAGIMYLLDKLPRKLDANVGRTFRYALRSAYIPYQALTTGILEDKIKAVLIVQCNPLISYPNARRVYQAFSQLEMLVVQEIFMTPTAALADYVLPVATTNECEAMGMYTGGRPFTAFPKIIEPPGEAWSDVKIINELAKRVGISEYFFDETNPEADLYDFILKYSGLSWEEFKKKRVNDVKRVDQREEGGFFHTYSGKAELYSERAVEVYDEDPLPTWANLKTFADLYPITNEYPLLITSYCDEEFHLTKYKHVRRFRKRKPYPTVQLHPDVAKQIGANEGDWVWIETKMGRIMQKLNIRPEIDPRVVVASFGWWYPEEPQNCCQYDKSNVNILFDDKPEERTTGATDCRGFPCRVFKVTDPTLIPTSDKYLKEEVAD